VGLSEICFSLMMMTVSYDLYMIYNWGTFFLCHIESTGFDSQYSNINYRKPHFKVNPYCCVVGFEFLFGKNQNQKCRSFTESFPYPIKNNNKAIIQISFFSSQIFLLYQPHQNLLFNNDFQKPTSI